MAELKPRASLWQVATEHAARLVQTDLDPDSQQFGAVQFDDQFDCSRNSDAADRSTCGSLPTLLSSILSFKGSASLLRACSLTQVLKGRGGILANAAGSEKTYALSFETDSIDVFVSHNWIVGRRQKFLALSYYFNIPLALTTFMIVQSVFVMLTVLGVLPIVRVSWAETPRGVSCRAAAVPFFLLALLLGGDFRRWFGLRGPSLFLDKACIHQTDKDIQMAGIRKLGAFLRSSKTMLVVYTDVYLTKLWTVYELACFLSLHSISNMKILPTVIPQTVLATATMFSLALPLVTFVETYTGFKFTLEVGFVLFGPLLATAFRREARARLAMRRRFTGFAVETCHCANEEDRPLVYGNIAQLMIAARKVPETATEEIALSKFNEVARQKLPSLVAAGIGRMGMRYRHAMTLSLLSFGPYCMDNCAGIKFDHQYWPVSLHLIVSSIWVVFFLTPQALGLCNTLTFSCMGLQGIWESVWVMVVCVWLPLVFEGLLYYIYEVLLEQSQFYSLREVNVFLCLCILAACLVVLSSSLITIWSFAPPGMTGLLIPRRGRHSMGWLRTAGTTKEPPGSEEVCSSCASTSTAGVGAANESEPPPMPYENTPSEMEDMFPWLDGHFVRV